MTEPSRLERLANYTETETELQMKALLKMKRKLRNSKASVCPLIQQKCNFKEKDKLRDMSKTAVA